MSKTKRQKDLAKIHIAKKELGLTEAHYRALVGGVLDMLGLPGSRSKPSSADLTAEGRSVLLGTFRQMGWNPMDTMERPSRRTPDKPRSEGPPRYQVPGHPGQVSHKQAGLIAHLERELGWADAPERLTGFMQRTLGLRKAVAMLTTREASSVISGLQRMLDGGYADEEAA